MLGFRIVMPTRNVNPTKVESGRYENTSAVVRAALRKAIDEGDVSGVAGRNPFDRVRRTLKLLRKKP
jgi:Arc/MetJ-type ribon-helix-helix transcriptional regulator